MPDVLFAPWRYEYLVADKSGGCIFCEALRDPEAPDSLVVFLGRKVLVAPYRHEAWLSDSDAATLSELIETIARAEKILVAEYHTDGLNIGINFGSAAGAGVADHYHVHVVPRWNGDTNFMTVAADLRIIPEEHAATLARLRPLFARGIE
jgi:ATP adenylyltransferase